nr:MAG TPA: hypothetical protein [Caudoviricetes sp.]
MFRKILSFILAFIGAVILQSFHYLQRLIGWIGMTVFLVYVVTIFFPLEILMKFKKFIGNPKEFTNNSFRFYKRFVRDSLS